jgi:alkylmercury lyase
MKNPNLDEIIKAWYFRTQQDSPLKMTSVCIQVIRFLAHGRPVSTDRFAALSHLPLDEVQAAFSQLKKCGAEFDDQGHLVGAILSLNPTPHQFRVNGRELFAWCALDTLFLPTLLQQSAQVESTCPATGAILRLTITPEGVQMLDPSGMILSIVTPGITPGCEPGAKSGPHGPVCSAMHFFSSGEAARPWLIAHPGLVIFSVQEAWQLAHEVWIEPFQAEIDELR